MRSAPSAGKSIGSASAPLPAKARTPSFRGRRLGRYGFNAFCVAAFVFLVAPILVIVPLSFNAEPYFTFTEGMLRLDPDAWSLRWYEAILNDEAWSRALANSLLIGVASTVLATTLGTLAALGLASPSMPGRSLVTAVLISPMITPIIIVAVGVFFFYSGLGLGQTHAGLILAHAALGAPFVVITVTATLAGFDRTVLRAAASLGAGPMRRFFRIQLPLISPGVFSGGLFAFAASFDEVVVVLFLGGLEQRTIPRQMWAGIREQISPAILALAVFLIAFAVVVLLTVEWLRNRSGSAQRSVH
ncbi:MAG: ABC transporter permease [Gammaproteobacteria bacterium]|nr:ABC transporter permease [Gammaproteobacteria bacterium]